MFLSCLKCLFSTISPDQGENYRRALSPVFTPSGISVKIALGWFWAILCCKMYHVWYINVRFRIESLHCIFLVCDWCPLSIVLYILCWTVLYWVPFEGNFVILTHPVYATRGVIWGAASQGKRNKEKRKKTIKKRKKREKKKKRENYYIWRAVFSNFSIVGWHWKINKKFAPSPRKSWNDVPVCYYI